MSTTAEAIEVRPFQVGSPETPWPTFEAASP
jgi:hypothetical protein